MDGLEAERHLQAPGEAVAQTQAALAHERGMRLDDDALEGAQQHGDRGVLLGPDRLRVEEAPGVVELDLPRGGSAARAARICAPTAPGGAGSGSVFFQRSHMRQRHGHSRLVRKIVATGTTSPDSAISFSTKAA